MADGSMGQEGGRRFEAGESVFDQGDPGDGAFLLISGCIGIYRRYSDFSLKLGVITPGQIFGEMSCVDGSEHMASAICETPVEVVFIERQAVERKLSESDPLIAKINSQLIKYIRSNNDSYARLMRANQMIKSILQAQDTEEALQLLPQMLERVFESCGGRLQLNQFDGSKTDVIIWGDGRLDGSEPAFSVPLRDGRDKLGVLQLNRRPPGDLSGEQFVLTVAGHVALALGNLRMRQKLEYMASRDGLTGLFNRGYAEEWLANEVRLTARRQSTLAIILMDLDFFKDINDSLGHQMGDDVLRAVGRLLTEAQRSGDMVSRFGGEEFLLGLVDCALSSAVQKAEKIRHDIEKLIVENDDLCVTRISASFGVAVFPDFGDTYPAVVKAADDALYRAKDQGRNRVEAAVK